MLVSLLLESPNLFSTSSRNLAVLLSQNTKIPAGLFAAVPNRRRGVTKLAVTAGYVKWTQPHHVTQTATTTTPGGTHRRRAPYPPTSLTPIAIFKNASPRPSTPPRLPFLHPHPPPPHPPPSFLSPPVVALHSDKPQTGYSHCTWFQVRGVLCPRLFSDRCF